MSQSSDAQQDSSSMSAEGGSGYRGVFPAARIRRIMKETPQVESIAEEGVVLTARALEIFLSQLVEESYKVTAGGDRVQLRYQDVADAIAAKTQYEFLDDIVPRKVKVKKLPPVRTLP